MTPATAIHHKAERKSTNGVAFLVAVSAILGACSDNNPVGVSPKVAPAPQLSASRASQDDSLPADYVVTPDGNYHKSCVHEIASDVTVDDDGRVHGKDGKVIRQFAKCAYPTFRSKLKHAKSGVATPTLNGWVESAVSAVDPSQFGGNPTGIMELDADIIVPPTPSSTYSSSGKVYYLFPGVEPDAGDNILQPVVSYGNNGSYGGAY